MDEQTLIHATFLAHRVTDEVWEVTRQPHACENFPSGAPDRNELVLMLGPKHVVRRVVAALNAFSRLERVPERSEVVRDRETAEAARALHACMAHGHLAPPRY